jgi:hypothetical protein
MRAEDVYYGTPGTLTEEQRERRRAFIAFLEADADANANADEN